MSKSRIKQRKNRQNGRYLRALDSCMAKEGPELYADERISRTDACGRKDLTGYNAVMLMENKNWTIVYK